MSMYAQFRTDPKLEKSGVVLEYADFRVTIARAGGSNKKFARVLESATKPYRRAVQTETMDNELAMKVLRKVYADSVVLNWETMVDTGKFDDEGEPICEWRRGIESPDGEGLLNFTPENVEETFRLLPELFSDIQEQANKIAIFREQALEDESKNS